MNSIKPILLLISILVIGSFCDDNSDNNSENWENLDNNWKDPDDEPESDCRTKEEWMFTCKRYS